MHNKKLRIAAAAFVLLVTTIVLVYYLTSHHSVVRQIKMISLTDLGVIFTLYVGTVVAIGLTLIATLQLCNVQLKMKEGMMLTMYSSVINFFGPLQSGPVFRAIYLKKKHKVSIKDYSLATFVYYLFYGAINCVFLLIHYVLLWVSIGVIVMIAGGLWLRFSNTNLSKRIMKLDLKSLCLLCAGTFLQIVLLNLIYFVELRAANHTIQFSQSIVYTGAANLALFVALTPGAIGFREAFLVFSRRLHHIGLSTIVAANIIDRFMYIVLLIVLIIIIFSTHISDQIKQEAT